MLEIIISAMSFFAVVLLIALFFRICSDIAVTVVKSVAEFFGIHKKNES